jgi:hypothetical protein
MSKSVTTRRRLLSGTAAAAAIATTCAEALPSSDLAQLVDQALAACELQAHMDERAEKLWDEYERRCPDWPLELRWSIADRSIIGVDEPTRARDGALICRLSEIEGLRERRMDPNLQARADAIVEASDRYTDLAYSLQDEIGYTRAQEAADQQQDRATMLFNQVIAYPVTTLADVRAKLRAFGYCRDHRGKPDGHTTDERILASLMRDLLPAAA